MVAGCVRAAESARRGASMLDLEGVGGASFFVQLWEDEKTAPDPHVPLDKWARSPSSSAGALRFPTTAHDVLRRRPPGCLFGNEDNPTPSVVRGVPRLVLGLQAFSSQTRLSASSYPPLRLALPRVYELTHIPVYRPVVLHRRIPLRPHHGYQKPVRTPPLANLRKLTSPPARAGSSRGRIWSSH